MRWIVVSLLAIIFSSYVSAITRNPNVSAMQPRKRVVRPPATRSTATIQKLMELHGGAQKQNTKQAVPSKSVGGGSATMTKLIFNLVKSIVGAGVLSLPAGIAAFGNAPSAIAPAVLLITLIGSISAYGFILIGRICAITSSSSYREAWDKTVGESTSWVTAFSSTFSCLFANLAYSMILADTFTNLFASIGIRSTRTQTLFGVTLGVLLPLCLMKNLSSLAPFSLLGIMGMVYTAFAMAIRYFGGAYGINGKFAGTMMPAFGDKGASAVFSPNSFILISMLSTAYMAHFAAPKFYTELENNTIERFTTVVNSSFGISIAIFCIVAALGFMTFGSDCNGLILNNYSNADSIMSLSRIAVALSIVFSYPLVFVGTREGILDLFNVKLEKRTNALSDKVTLLTLTIITVGALVVNDLGFVLSFAGATLGNALIYVFPAMMFNKMVDKLGDKATAEQKAEVKFATFTCLLGIAMGGIGAFMSIKNL